MKLHIAFDIDTNNPDHMYLLQAIVQRVPEHGVLIGQQVEIELTNVEEPLKEEEPDGVDEEPEEPEVEETEVEVRESLKDRFMRIRDAIEPRERDQLQDAIKASLRKGGVVKLSDVQTDSALEDELNDVFDAFQKS